MSKKNIKYALERIKKEPYLFIPGLFAWLKGWYYKVLFKILFKDFKAGPLFRVYGPLVVSGPGRVRLGSNCIVISNAIKPVCIRTLVPNAEFSMGDNAGLNGTSIQCVGKIVIGDSSNIADAYITDSPGHSVAQDRREESIMDYPSFPVNIGKNVWVSTQVVILHGVKIGDNSVIGACSLIREDVPSNVFMAGNPLKMIRKIDE